MKQAKLTATSTEVPIEQVRAAKRHHNTDAGATTTARNNEVFEMDFKNDTIWNHKLLKNLLKKLKKLLKNLLKRFSFFSAMISSGLECLGAKPKTAMTNASRMDPNTQLAGEILVPVEGGPGG
jgi:hypothetical protein